jgi:cytochrome oxidase assembly protein ShyY1
MSTATDPVRGPATPSAPERTPDRGGWRRLAFLGTPKWIALIIGVIAFAMACYLILAPWQFGRNSQRSAQNAAIEAARQAAPVPISSLMSTAAEPGTASTWHRVRVTGTFVPSSEAYVRLRQDAGGNPASEVVVTLLTTDGTAVLVDRGYVPATSVTAGAPLPALPTGTVTIVGRVQQDEVDPQHRPPQPAPDGRQQFYAVNAEQVTGTADSYRGYLQLTEDSPAVLTAIGMPQIDSGPFLSYALQWLAFGAMAVMGIGYFIYRELTEPAEDPYLPDDGGEPGNEGEPATQTAPGPPAAQAAPAAQGAPAAPPAPGTEPGRLARRRRWDRSELYDPE